VLPPYSWKKYVAWKLKCGYRELPGSQGEELNAVQLKMFWSLLTATVAHWLNITHGPYSPALHLQAAFSFPVPQQCAVAV